MAIPLALLALAACAVAAALAIWKMRQNSTPTIPAIATDVGAVNALTVSPIYESRTQTHVNELYAGDEAPAGAGALGSASNNRDELFRAHNMSWDRV